MVLDAVLVVLILGLSTAAVRAGLVGRRGRSLPFFAAPMTSLLAWGLLLPRLERFSTLSDAGLTALLVLTVGAGGGIGFLVCRPLARWFERDTSDDPPPEPIQRLDSWAGGVAAVLLLLAGLWLWYPVLRALDGWVGDQADDSRVLTGVDRVTLAPLGVVSGPTTLIDRYPSVFDAGARPPERGFPPPDSLVDEDIQGLVAEQVVRITGVACSRPIEGTGFVTESGYVLTNAHVVAGQTRTTVHLGNDDWAATVIGFDPQRDLALLALPAPVGPGLGTATAGVGTIGAAFGHPAGRDLRVAPFQITDRVTGTGLDIYGEGDVRRKVFFLAADLESGDSGAPVVDSRGRVVGIVFAISPDERRVAFALTSSEIDDFLAEDRSDPVGPTECR